MRKKTEWTPEIDDAIRDLYKRHYSFREMAFEIERYGLHVSGDTVYKHCMAIGIHEKQPYVPRTHFTTEQKYFCFVNQDMPLDKLRDAFNARFNLEWPTAKIYRVIVSARADKEQRLTKTAFIEEWQELQRLFLQQPDQVASRHWLWRWKRSNRTTSSGCVFRGTGEKMPHIFTTRQFAKEWREMQRLFGVVG